MNDIAIVALLTGIKQTSVLHGIQENEILQWIKDLDLEANQFFLKLRKYIVETTKKIGEEAAVERFRIPVEVLTIMLLEFSEDLPSIDLKELKKRAIMYYLKNLTVLDISNKIGVNIEQVDKWILAYNLATKKKNNEENLNKQEIKEDLDVLVIDELKKVENEEIRKIDNEVIEVLKDEFDLIMEESIR